MKRTDDLRDLMQSWGFHQVNRYSEYRAILSDEPATENPISKAREFAPMTRANVARKLIGRDGSSRRRLMAKQLWDPASGSQILEMVPMWACDPMPPRTQPAGGASTRRAAADTGSPDHLRWIDRAMSELARACLMRERVVREEFCGSGTHAEKAGRIEREYGGEFTLNQYRYELRRGMDFLRGRRPLFDAHAA